MGTFTPNFTGLGQGTKGTLPFPTSIGSSSIPMGPPDINAGVPNNNAATPGYGWSYAGGGALPNTNKDLITPTLDPSLTNALLDYMGHQIGKGLPSFNQSVALPTGGQSTPGSLTAPLNPVLQQLQDFMTDKSGPGGLPGVLPMWQSEISAMQQPIQQNLANLREQFGSMGAGASTEAGAASSNYLSQVSADQMSLLTQATMQSLPQMLQAGEAYQGIDQAAITNAFQQFQMDLPQNNPTLQDQMQLALAHPGSTYQKQPSTLQSILSDIPLFGGLLSNAGSAASAAFPNMPGWLSILLGA